jgi:type VI secretion system protein
MAIKPRLFERLRERYEAANREGGGKPHHGDDLSVVVDSVRRHVTTLLNTRQGSVLLDPDFGVPDFTNLGSHFSRLDLPRLERTMVEYISRYEPRLRNIHILFDPPGDDHFTLAFSITAELAVDTDTGSSAMPLRFLSSVTQTGMVKVDQ